MPSVRPLALAFLASTLSAQAPVWRITLPVSGSTSQALSPKGDQVAVAPTFGPVLAFHVRSGALDRAWTRPSQRTYSLAWAPDGRGFYFGDPDLRGPFGLRGFGGPAPGPLRGGVHQVSPDPGGRWLASVDYESLQVVDLRDGRPLTWLDQVQPTWRGPLGNVRLVLWEGPGRLVVVQGGWGSPTTFAVRRYDLGHRRSLPEIRLPEGCVATSAALDPTRGHLWLGTEKGALIRVDLAAGRVAWEGTLGDRRVQALALGPGPRLAAWVGAAVTILDPEAPHLPHLDLAAWDTSDAGGGWRPLLAWVGRDLVLASGTQEGTWRAERHPLPRRPDPVPGVQTEARLR